MSNHPEAALRALEQKWRKQVDEYADREVRLAMAHHADELAAILRQIEAAADDWVKENGFLVTALNDIAHTTSLDFAKAAAQNALTVLAAQDAAPQSAPKAAEPQCPFVETSREGTSYCRLNGPPQDAKGEPRWQPIVYWLIERNQTHGEPEARWFSERKCFAQGEEDLWVMDVMRAERFKTKELAEFSIRERFTDDSRYPVMPIATEHFDVTCPQHDYFQSDGRGQTSAQCPKHESANNAGVATGSRKDSARESDPGRPSDLSSEPQAKHWRKAIAELSEQVLTPLDTSKVEQRARALAQAEQAAKGEG